MANEKIINSRIQNKVDTETNWTTAGQNGFIPKNGEFIIYKEDETHPLRRVKIGDGITPVHELPFVTDAVNVTAITDEEIDEICSGTLTTFLEDIAAEGVSF